MEAQLDLNLNNEQKEILLQLNGIDEFRMKALLHAKVIQHKRKIWHDENIKEKQFQESFWALLYVSRYKYFKGKLGARWLGPYVVEICHDNGSVQIRTIDEEAIPLLVNGYRLKIYKRPLWKQEFNDDINKTMMVLEQVLDPTSSNNSEKKEKE